MVRKLAVVSLTTLAILLIAGFAQAESQPFMTRHVREVVIDGQAQLVGKLPATQTLHFDIVLPVRDRTGLQSFVGELNNPASAFYHLFITPEEFTQRFGPTQDEWAALVAFAKANGFQITGGSRDAMDLRLVGTVANIEKAFHVSMNTYQHPSENRTFYSLDREPTADLGFQLWHVSGLDNYSKPHPMYETKSDFAKAHGISPEQVVSHATTGSGPSASFLGSDMRAAYYCNGTCGSGALTGSGQNVGLFEYYGTDLADLTTYYKNVGQTEPFTPKLISTDGTSTSCVDSGSQKCDDTEQTLDMTQAMGMAPGMTMLYMYVGSTDSAIISAMTVTTDAPLSKQIGCSWGWTPADASTLDPYFEKMASQGQNFFVAAGDSSAWSASNEAWPADDANIVSVGGTDLVTSSAAGPWSSETAWADSGGGVSPDKIAIPSWQTPVDGCSGCSKTYRNGPDVAANANFTFYVCADQTTCTANDYGGTSFAAPMWAAYLALANQQATTNGDSIGFIDPNIYPAAEGSSYSTYFHDITSGSCGTYSAATGYDLCTGWGSPKTNGLITLLAGSSGTQSFTLAASPSSLTVTQGSNGTSTITVTDVNGFDGSVTLAASGLPSGVTASFGTNPTTSTSVLTLTASSTATTGTATVTITGTSGSLTATTTVALTVSAAASANFTIAASPTSLSVAQSANGTSTITITSQNSFSSATTLSATGLPSGVTASFGTNPVTPPANGSATSVLTLTASSSATTGAATVTVTGTSGSLSHSTTIALTVTAAGGGAQIATYNSTYTAPACLTAGTSCASGTSVSTSLLNSAGNLSSPTEANKPNTLKASSCADGSVSGTYHGAYESNDMIVVSSASGNLTHGTSVTVKASWWAYSTSQDYLDVFYSASVTSPSWVLVSANNKATSISAENTTSVTFTPPTAGTYAVRVQERYDPNGKVTTPSACQSNSGYDDHDDLVFVVQ